jgi:uncharacterized cupredoxin-like copper-binding protein
MKRAPTLIALAALLALCGLRTLVSADAAPAPERLQVTEKEYSLILSRLRVHRGTAIVQVVNFGMDSHDLVIQANAKGSKPIHFQQLGPGTHATKTIKLPPGKYTLWCSLPGHRQLGMVAPLTVSK